MLRAHAFVLLAALLLLAPAVAAESAKGDVFKLIGVEAAVVAQTNVERKNAGLAPLTLNAKLSSAARAHALNMARQDKLEHTLDDKRPDERVTAAGYRWSGTAENIAWNSRSPKDVVAGWMDSPPHKKNMLNSDYTEIGVAVAWNEKGEPYWVQVFGKPRR